MHKGTASRVENFRKFDENYENIFGKKPPSTILEDQTPRGHDEYKLGPKRKMKRESKDRHVTVR